MVIENDLSTLHNKTGNGIYPAFVPNKRVFFRAEETKTKVVTIASGQVLKAHSFLMSNAAGKHVAHSGFNESATVTFAAITSGQTLVVGGITFTSGSAGTTAAQLVTIFTSIAPADTSTAANVKILAAGIATTVGTFTAGTFSGWTVEKSSASAVLFNSVASVTNPSDLAFTGTATAPTIAIVQGSTALAPVGGVLCYDVDASASDVQAPAYTEASFMASGLVWAVNPAVDTILKADGVTSVAVTPYNTGCAGTSDASNLLKQKFVENTEFEPLGFIRTGEYY